MAARRRSLSMGDLMRSSQYRAPEPMHMMYSHRLEAMITRAKENSEKTVSSFLSSLPKLTEKELAANGHAESSCPICLSLFSTILTEEEMALAMDTPAHPIEDLGVTQLAKCGHVFCVKDIRNWVLQGHNTCPFCRTALMNLPDFSHDEGLADEISTLSRQMQASLASISAYHEAHETAIPPPLTSEQVASLRSAIALLRQGDNLEDLPLPLHTADLQESNPDTRHDHDDRDGFGGMYS